MEKEKYYGEIAVPSLLNSICNNGGYTKQIHKRTTKKTMEIGTVLNCVRL